MAADGKWEAAVAAVLWQVATVAAEELEAAMALERTVRATEQQVVAAVVVRRTVHTVCGMNRCETCMRNTPTEPLLALPWRAYG